MADAPNPIPSTHGCNGMCITAAEVGVMVAGIAYSHPDCPAHGEDAPPAGHISAHFERPL